MKGTVFTGGRVLTGGALRETEVLVRSGRIAAVGGGLDRTGCEVVELAGKHPLARLHRCAHARRRGRGRERRRL